jgi:hypothetical protein
MANIVEIIKTFNVQLALKNIYSKIDEIIRKLNDSEPKYKVYTALLTQTGIDAPVATVLENTLGLNPTYNYAYSGSYYLEDLAGLFLSNKTAVFMQFQNGGPTFEIFVDNVNQVYVGTAGQNDQLLNTFIEIRVYN